MQSLYHCSLPDWNPDEAGDTELRFPELSAAILLCQEAHAQLSNPDTTQL